MTIDYKNKYLAFFISKNIINSHIPYCPILCSLFLARGDRGGLSQPFYNNLNDSTFSFLLKSYMSISAHIFVFDCIPRL